MGMRMQCAQCHNHPFDRWTMDDYYSFAAFFSQIGRKQGEDYRETIVFNSGGGEVKHPVGGRVMTPKFLGGDAARRRRQGPPRGAGRVAGLARESVLRHQRRQPRLGPLLRHRHRRAGRRRPRQQSRRATPSCSTSWATSCIEYNYDFKQLVRDICNSQTYQRIDASATNATRPTRRNFAHGNVRRIQAEMLLDCISQVTEHEGQVPGPAARRPGRADRRRQHQQLLPDDLRPRDARDRLLLRSEDGADAVAGPAPAQRRHGPGQDSAGRRRQEAARRRQDARSKSIEALYIRCLSPQADAGGAGQAAWPSSPRPRTRKHGLEDVFWAVLNSREFLFNH